MMPVLDPKEVAATNPAVDPEKIQQVKEIRQAMEKAGIVMKANYRLSPPLGDGPVKPARAGRFAIRMSRLT